MAQAIHLLSTTIIVILCLTVRVASAQSGPQSKTLENVKISTISVISGDFSGTLRGMADDLAATLNDGDNLRVLPVFGIGGDETASDALFLKAMDVAFVHSDLPAYAIRQGLDEIIENHLRYIAKLHVKDVGIIASKSIKNIRELAGKKVNFDHTTSSNFLTSTIVFEMLGIEVESVQLSQAVAIEKIKTGEIAATVFVDEKPNKMLATLRLQDGLHLVPIEHTGELQNVYLPTVLTNDDYPNLIASGQSIDSIGVAVVLAMYNWSPGDDRYNRVSRFAEAFFSKFQELRQTSRHPNWREVNIAAQLPGWTRFKPAEEWLASNGDSAVAKGAMSKLRIAFQKFVEHQVAQTGKSLTEAQERILFKEFLGWKNNTTKATIRIHMTSADGVGKPVGTISAQNIEIEIGGVPELALLLKPDLAALPQGPHALHVHVNPRCGPGEKEGIIVAGFDAGGHLYLSQEGKSYGIHLGDLPDLIVAADGTADEAIIVPRLSMADLLDHSIMIHANGSDASPRLACGVIN